MNVKKYTVFCVFSGILTALSFIFPEFYFVVFISFTPTFYDIISKKTTAFTAMFFHLYTFYIFADLWFFSVGYNYTEKKSGFFLSFFIVTAIALILSLTASAPFLLIKKFKSYNPIILTFTVSFLYILGEWFHGIAPISFSWNRLCNIVAYNNDIIASCSIFGGLFVSLIIVMINMCFAYFFYFLKTIRIASVLCIVSASVIFLINVIIGSAADVHYETENEDSSEILLIQPNYTREIKRKLSNNQKLDGYLKQAEASITDKTELIILPETAISHDFFTDSIYRNRLCDFVKEKEISMLFGTSKYVNNKKYNACIMIYPNGNLSQMYAKRRLVPFGEYTPSFLPQNLHFLKNAFSKGDETAVIESAVGKIGCAICFESVFPAVCCENTRLGAQLLVILSNDSWIGNTVPLYQHHSHSIIRAAENRKYTITCANTGISSVISPDGKIISASEKNQKQNILAEVSPNNIITFYARHGDLIIVPSFIAFFVLLLSRCIYFIKNLHIVFF
ncbi:MAG: apolipoprotein N-acyltransferase [Ruminococcus sp.]|nr:apolipoprotein N-acyltransferase [Ruminococcus sp.]